MIDRVPVLGLLIKTYADDASYALRLLASIARHNVEHLPVFVVAPDPDLRLFEAIDDPDVRLVTESRFAEHLVGEAIAGIAPGYINQEIVKLCFWEEGVVSNYLCVDSDAVFIRDFGRSDFMADESTPYTFLTEDAELRVEPEYYATYWKAREPKLRRIQEAVGLSSDRLLTCHGHAVLSSSVLESLKEDFMKPHGYSYADLLRISPYEFSWYNMWLQRAESIPIVMREPVFKTFHNASQYLEYLLRGVTQEDMARGYVGVIVNSGFGRAGGELDTTIPRYKVLGRYVGTRDLVSAARLGVLQRMPRIRRLLGGSA